MLYESYIEGNWKTFSIVASVYYVIESELVRSHPSIMYGWNIIIFEISIRREYDDKKKTKIDSNM